MNLCRLAVGAWLAASLSAPCLLSAGDTPGTPSSLSAVAFSSSEVSLEWLPPTGNDAVAGYKIYRNGTLLTSTTAPLYQDSGLAAVTTYTYTVEAYDAANNLSAQSSPGSVTTPASGVQAAFFAIDQNNFSSPWPPTTGTGAVAPVAALRLWDDGSNWMDVEVCSALGVSGDSPTDPNNKCYTWTALDKWVRVWAPKAKMDVLYTFGDTPAWATSQIAPQTACARAGTYSCLPPVDVDKTPGSGLGDGTDATWVDFVTTLVTRYKGQIKYYEIWNEPDGNTFWQGTDAQFQRMMKDAAAAIRSIDPGARILSPSFHGPTATTWFAKFVEGGGAADFDIVNFHGRGGGKDTPQDQNTQPESFLTVYNATEPVIKAHGLASRPFWDDEAGWLENEITDPDQQAAYVAREYILQASVGIGRLYWYQWDSVVPYGLQGRIAGTAYAQTANWLVGGTIGACTARSAVYSCPLTLASGHQGLIMWDTSQSCANGTCTSVPTSVGAQYGQYQDLAGTTIQIANGSVPLGAKPLLLETAAGNFVLNIGALPARGGTVTPATGSAYNSGTVVHIAAVAEPGYVFTGWTGNVADAATATTTITMNGPETITANFSIANPIRTRRRP
jgi:uncharacterized repeat protein (TIGR02543 family)